MDGWPCYGTLTSRLFSLLNHSALCRLLEARLAPKGVPAFRSSSLSLLVPD